MTQVSAKVIVHTRAHACTRAHADGRAVWSRERANSVCVVRTRDRWLKCVCVYLCVWLGGGGGGGGRGDDVIIDPSGTSRTTRFGSDASMRAFASAAGFPTRASTECAAGLELGLGFLANTHASHGRLINLVRGYTDEQCPARFVCLGSRQALYGQGA